MQNITRDIEIKYRLTATRAEGEEGIWGKISRKSHQGTCIKDTWTKPKGVGSRVGGRGRGGVKMETVLEAQ